MHARGRLPVARVVFRRLPVSLSGRRPRTVAEALGELSVLRMTRHRANRPGPAAVIGSAGLRRLRGASFPGLSSPQPAARCSKTQELPVSNRHSKRWRLPAFPKNQPPAFSPFDCKDKRPSEPSGRAGNTIYSCSQTKIPRNNLKPVRITSRMGADRKPRTKSRPRIPDPPFSHSDQAANVYPNGV